MGSNEIRRTQNEYFRLLESHLRSDEKQSLTQLTKSPLRSFIVAKLQPMGASKGDFELRLDELLKSVSQHWKACGAQLVKQFRDMGAYSLTLQSQGFALALESHARRLGVYFDTLLFVDPLHLQPDTWLEYSLDSPQRLTRKAVLVERLAAMLRLRSLCLAQTDFPIFMVVPDNAVTNAKGYENRVLPMLAEVLFDDRACADDFKAFGNAVSRLTGDRDVAHIAEFSSLRNIAGPPGEATYAGQPGANDLLLINGADISRMPIRMQVLSVLQLLMDTLHDIDQCTANGLAAGSDPVFNNLFETLFANSQHLLLKELAAHVGSADEEILTAKALIGNDLDMLETVTTSDLVRLRENAGLESVRTALRSERELVRLYRTDPSRAVSQLSAHVREVIAEAGDEYAKARKGRVAGLKWAGLSFGASAALGVASLAFPAIAILSIVGFAAGTLVGGKSALDLYKQYRDDSSQLKTIESSPMFMLYGATSR